MTDELVSLSLTFAWLELREYGLGQLTKWELNSVQLIHMCHTPQKPEYVSTHLYTINSFTFLLFP